MATQLPCDPLVLLAVWLALVLAGYMGIFWALNAGSPRDAFAVSGSSLFTLGFATTAGDLIVTVLSFSEAMVGLVLVALLIAYLPTIYSAFSRRELAVTLLEVRAGTPPSAVEMLTRFHRIGKMDELAALWPTWEAWFADVDETHTSLAALCFFRSPQPYRSWVTAAGTVLDAAALAASTLDLPRDAHEDLCLRAGFIALRHIADFFHIPHNSAPKPDDPISVSRAEYDEVVNKLAAVGFPLKPDRDQAWRDFVGWRVNYDTVLIALAWLTMAPAAMWSSDRVDMTQRRLARARKS